MTPALTPAAWASSLLSRTTPSCGDLDHLLPRGRHALRQGAGELHADAGDLLPVRRPGILSPMASAEPLGARVYQAIQSRNLRIVGGQVRRLDDARHLLEVAALPLAQAPDDARHLAGGERHLHHVALLEGEAVRHGVGIGRVQRQRDEDIGDLGSHQGTGANNRGHGDSLDPISLLESKHGPAHIPAAKHVGELVPCEEARGQSICACDTSGSIGISNIRRPAGTGPLRTVMKNLPSGREQARDPRQGPASLVLVEMHPHGRHQDEIEALAARMNLRQIRQGIVDPDDIRIGMKALPMGPQLGGRLDGVNLKAALLPERPHRGPCRHRYPRPCRPSAEASWSGR